MAERSIAGDYYYERRRMEEAFTGEPHYKDESYIQKHYRHALHYILFLENIGMMPSFGTGALEKALEIFDTFYFDEDSRPNFSPKICNLHTIKEYYIVAKHVAEAAGLREYAERMELRIKDLEKTGEIGG